MSGAGCGDNNFNVPDASGDAPVDVAPDAPIDAPQEPILRITLKLEDLLALAPQDALSSYGRASGIAPFGANGSSWQYTKPSTGHPSDKFELIMPFASLPNVTTPPELAAILEHLGPITLADIASIKVHTKHSAATTTDFTLIAYTKPDGTDDDASWYGRRIHALLQWAASRSAPADTWNEYATSTGTNQIQFWDFRNANVAQGIQPANNYFTLADIKAGPITPAGISGARDYRAEQLQYLAFTTFSSNTAFDGAIDGIELVLNNGKGVNIDLDGDSNVYRTKVSLTQMRARHGNGNSYGIDGTASSSMPYAGATSWRYIKGAGAPADEKLEFHVPFAISDGEDVDALWEPMRTHLGDFTLGEIASIKLRTRRPAGAAYNFAVLVYTRADGTDDDASWYGRRLHAYLDWAASPSAPADTWNTYSTASGTNQLQFWDYRNANVQQGVQPANNFFTLATLQAGPVTPAGVTGARDYRAEKVKFVTLATYSNFPTFEGSLDGLEITLTNGKQLVLDLEQ